MERVKCVIPDMMYGEKATGKGKPKCNSSEEVGEFMGRVSRFRAEAESELRNCSCPQPCLLREYHLSQVPGSISRLTSDPHRIFLDIQFPTTKVETFKEQPATSLVEILSEIGGCVGVCLGLSILTVYEILEVSFFFLCSRVKGF
ncbi:unnamed protein product [Darwinula stevensoni]|uniref:Uncharacterized protein n=1 Tax=Darwinula stevensoni TaxID=69355 RepID=A0A7R8XG03_9CRUS|nr:unnamed protein product [Darwinula stevensoni]CAG0891024.1 unnamed protein product [Darwinula stevensoni]